MLPRYYTSHKYIIKYNINNNNLIFSQKGKGKTKKNGNPLRGLHQQI